MSKWPHFSALPTVSSLEKWLKDSDTLDEDFEHDVHETFQIFVQLAKDDKLKKCFWLPNIKKVAPMEFLCISLLIYSFKRKMTLAQLSEAITLLRKDIRTVEKDVRMNGRLMKQVLTFLKGLHPSKLKAQSGEPAASQVQAPENPAPKRKRKSPAGGDPPSKRAAPSRPQATKSNPSPPPSKPTPPPRPPSTSRPPNAPATQPSTSSPGLGPPPPPPLSIPSGPSNTRAPPTAPASYRQAVASSSMPSPNLPRPMASLPPRPPSGPLPRQNSIGDALMARMASAPSPVPPGPRHGGYPSPSMSFYPGPNDPPGSRGYEASRDPRHPAYHQDARGYGGQGQPPGQPPYPGGRRY